MDVPYDKKPASQRVTAYRDRMRSRGLRPVQMWITDVRTEEFLLEAHRQAAAVAASEYGAEDQEFIDAVSTDDA